MKIFIRPEQSKDIPAIHALNASAFPTDAEARLVDILRANGKAIYSFAAVNDDDEVLGHVLYSRVTTPLPSNGLGLAPVAVKPKFQNQGIGSQLIRASLVEVKADGYDFVVLLGDPAYYQRFGFQAASAFGLQNEYGVDEEFMVLNLSGRELPRGLVRYAEEFGIFSV
ncbi:MAG: N-acetyltransferase [Chloroflexi bacterium]|nr:N-acetyltransferase [Chloroflexota bacterium]